MKTVVVSSGPIDTDEYSAAEYPLIEIVPSSEIPMPYLTGRHALWRNRVVLTCYYLGVNTDWEQGEALFKEVKDALGGDPTLNETCASVSVSDIRNSGEFPMWKVIATIEMKYEKRISDA
jgi:hypothetical protein